MVVVVASVATLVIRAHPSALGCPGAALSSVIDCQSVVSSPFGVVLGLPLGDWSLVWLIGWWGSRVWRRAAPVAPFWSAVGLMGVAYAIGTEARIGHLCAWCTLNQVAIVVLAAVLGRRGVPKRGMGHDA
nr:vitamin K epoxide reductase family protein [Sulfobacillus harzensis]